MDSENTKPGERRSERKKRRRESYSPELKSDSKLKKQSSGSKPKPSNRAHPRRLYDVMPNGEPFCCHMCRSPYVASHSNKPGKKNERSRHVPLPKTRVDKTTGREMVLCNACAQTFDRPRLRIKKPVPAPTEEELEAYTQEANEFVKLLRQTYNDPRVEKLYCPVSKKKLCGCLQKYIKSKGVEGAESPVPKFLELMKEAEMLRKEKAYATVGENSKSKKFIGLGNGHKKSKRYEEFVLLKREQLKDTMRLCERAVQRVLIYSNNFLHKKLKTENRPCRIERTRGKAAMGKLPDLHTLVELTCCSDNCVMLALTHRKLLQEWRERAQQGQMEARRVLAEMLTPAGASHCNCYQFISMVTGCSTTTIGRVCNQMIDTHGNRDPPEHGMKKVWQENYKKNRVSTSDTDRTDEVDIQSNSGSQLPTAPSSRQEVTSEATSANQITATTTSLQYELQQQKLALIQQEISQKQQQKLVLIQQEISQKQQQKLALIQQEISQKQQQKLSLIQQEISQKQQQLQQQEVNLQLLAQQVSSSSSSGENWQINTRGSSSNVDLSIHNRLEKYDPTISHTVNTAFVQQLFKQLTSQNAAAGNSSIEVLQLSQQLPGKTVPTQHGFQGNKSTLMTSQSQPLIVQQQQQLPIASPTNMQWNQTSQQTLPQTHLNVSGNQSIIQLPLPVKQAQLLANQSYGSSALNQSQFSVSQNQTHLPVTFNQLPQQLTPNQTPVFLPMNQFNIIVSQTGQILNASQMVGQRPPVNVQNVLLDSSQVILDSSQKDGNQSIDSSGHALQSLQSERQPVENQSVQIQLVPCQTPTVADNQPVNQQSFGEGNSVQLQEVESTPIVLSPEMVQQLINSGNLQILPQVNVARNTTDEIQETVQPDNNQDSTAGTLNNLSVAAAVAAPAAVSRESVQDSTMTQFSDQMSMPPDHILTPNQHTGIINSLEENYVKSQDQKRPQVPKQTLGNKVMQISSDNNQTNSSVIQKVVPKSKSVYRERQHISSTEHKKKKSAVQLVSTAAREADISNKTAETPKTSLAMIAHTSTDIATTSKLGTREISDYTAGSNAPENISRGQGYATTQFPVGNSGEMPSQIQISFETVIDKNGQTATSHIILPHSNVLTLPIIPLYSVSSEQPDGEKESQTQTTVEIAEKSAQVTKLVQADVGDKKSGSRNEKTKATKRGTRKLAEKSKQVGNIGKNKGIKIMQFETDERGGDSYVQLKNESIDVMDGKEVIGQDTSQTRDIGDYGKSESGFSEKSRHVSETYDKSRHSSGSSIRSRQSSGNSECLKHVLSFDSLRPLSGMSDILERSRQYSGNSQITVRSRTSSGNSYLNEQMHNSAFQNISPTALLNKEKGVFFVSSDADLSEMNSLHIPDSVHHISDFILNDEHISELHGQTEIEAFVDNQSQSHEQTGPLPDLSKTTTAVDNSDNQSQVQADYRSVMKQSKQLQSEIGSDVINQSHTDESFHQATEVNVHHSASRGNPELLDKHEAPDIDDREFLQDQVSDRDQLQASNQFQLLNQSAVLQVSQSSPADRHTNRISEQNLTLGAPAIQMARSVMASSETVAGKTPVLNSLLLKPPKFITWSQNNESSEQGSR